MNTDTHYTPVIILGAGRSGTNVLRDVLTSLPGFATWPCDEIQPIWRHGNLQWPDDEFTAKMATPKISAFIQKQFTKQWARLGKPAFLVEKTCASTLRVPFINAVLPNAVYIQIIRHGADVVKSAEKRWRGDLELPSFSYFLAKARYIPILDVPSYFWSFVSKRIGLLSGKSKQLSSWGPRFNGIDRLHGTDLSEMCAHQWSACTKASRTGLANIPPDRHITIYYEDLVSAPDKELMRIMALLKVPYTQEQLATAVGIVRVKPGKIKHSVLKSETAQNLLAPELSASGYEETV